MQVDGSSVYSRFSTCGDRDPIRQRDFYSRRCLPAMRRFALRRTKATGATARPRPNTLQLGCSGSPLPESALLKMICLPTLGFEANEELHTSGAPAVAGF